MIYLLYFPNRHWGYHSGFAYRDGGAASSSNP